MKKSIILFKITVLLLLFLRFSSVFSQVSVWDGTHTPFTNGTGKEADPYLIESAQHLAHLAYLVNEGTGTTIGKNTYYKMTVSIDLNGSESLQWTPIGYSKRFGGHLDGAGHTITNLYINSTTLQYAGLFGRIDGGSIKNVALIGNNSITIDNNTSMISIYIGGIVGDCQGAVTLERLSYSGNISSPNSSSRSYFGGIVGSQSSIGTLTISNCYNTGSVSSSSLSYSHSGGIIGVNPGTLTISNCYNTGNISSSNSTYSYSGGIIGSSSLSTLIINNCYNIGDISSSNSSSAYCGGIVGDNTGTSTATLNINNCYNTGNLSSSSGSSSCGGIVGRCLLGSGSVTIANSYNTGATTHAIIASAGAVITNTHYLNTCSSNNSNGGTPQTEGFMKSAAFVILLGEAYRQDLVPWINNGYPVLCAIHPIPVWDGANTPFTNGTGTENDPYLIENEQHLAHLAYLVNNGIGADADRVVGRNKYYKMIADLNLRGNELQWVPIGFYISATNHFSFGGHFDGNGHTISHLYVNTVTRQRTGLFGNLYDGTVKNLGIIGNSSLLAAHYCAGAIAALTLGNSTISNCYYTGEITSNAEGNVQYFGGIVGLNEGNLTVADCYNTGNISVSSAASRSGGIIGINMGTLMVKHCYNMGEIKSSAGSSGGILGYTDGNVTIYGCYNTGIVSSGTFSGGIVGTRANGSVRISNSYNIGTASHAMIASGGAIITNSYYLNSCSGNNSNGGTPKTEEFMKSFDFVNLLGNAFRQDIMP